MSAARAKKPRPVAPTPALDRTDRSILRALQRDASVSNVALAAK
ncbi:MAG: Lrp/AsnC family transcriptional regulator, partial [Burkholderiales bacterium]|nr:Lrp/AsnC family transcriptional regulator [Burkholderiales bacterium]